MNILNIASPASAFDLMVLTFSFSNVKKEYNGSKWM